MIDVNDNFDIEAPKVIDARYGPYADINTALASVPIYKRALGLTIGIGSPILEYWWSSGLANENLILKTADTSIEWGDIEGNLSDQTDLQNALDSKQNDLGFTPVPDSRNLTINGITYNLEADRSWTISSSQWIDTTGGIQYPNNVGIDINLSRMTQVDLSNELNNFTISNYDTLSNGAVIYRNYSGGSDIPPLINGNTYYIKKVSGTANAYGTYSANFQVELFLNSNFTGSIRLTADIVGNHYLEQSNRTLTNTIISNQNFQIDDGFLLINAKQYKSGDVHWISPKSRFLDAYVNDGDGGVFETSTQGLRSTTLLIGPYLENSTSIWDSSGCIILHGTSSPTAFLGLNYNGVNYGISAVLPALSPNTASVGGFYTGMGIASTQSVSDSQPSFGILAQGQSGNGRGVINFTAYNNKRIETFNNVLDNGSGRIGINTAPSEMLHIFLNESIASTIIRVDNKAQQSQTLGGQLAFYRDQSGSVISGATLLGKITTFGLSATPSTFIESASMEIRAISGAWTTTTNRSAQFLFFTRHQNTYAERMRLASDGNLLIGSTTASGRKLQVNGGIEGTQYWVGSTQGVSGTFNTADASKTITVNNGIITSIV